MEQLEDITSPEFSVAMKIRANANLDTSAKQVKLLLYLARNQQIHIFLDTKSKPIGYVAWSKLTNDTMRLLPEMNGNVKYPYERSDGYLYLIDDLVMIPAQVGSRTEMWLNFLKKIRFFAYVRNNKLNVCVRRNNKHKSINISFQ